MALRAPVTQCWHPCTGPALPVTVPLLGRAPCAPARLWARRQHPAPQLRPTRGGGGGGGQLLLRDINKRERNRGGRARAAAPTLPGRGGRHCGFPRTPQPRQRAPGGTGVTAAHTWTSRPSAAHGMLEAQRWLLPLPCPWHCHQCPEGPAPAPLLSLLPQGGWHCQGRGHAARAAW